LLRVQAMIASREACPVIVSGLPDTKFTLLLRIASKL
jgi:hypothetical protein